MGKIKFDNKQSDLTTKAKKDIEAIVKKTPPAKPKTKK